MVGFRQQTVIDHLSLDVRRGEILGLVGASGGGKSVLMRTIIGLIPKRSGHIEVMGVDIDNSHGRDVHTAAMWGILFQQGALFSSLTALQNVQFPLRENLVLSEVAIERDCDRQARDGWLDARGRRQVSVRTLGRNDKARRAWRVRSRLTPQSFFSTSRRPGWTRSRRATSMT